VETRQLTTIAALITAAEGFIEEAKQILIFDIFPPSSNNYPSRN
jgi:hypothetical protein